MRMAGQAIILMVHGSKDPRWRKPFEDLLDALREDLGADVVHLAYMESGQPDLLRVSRAVHAGGLNRAFVLPLFMAGGGHVDHDLPGLVHQAEKAVPGLDLELLPPIGEHPRFIELLRAIVRDRYRQLE